MHGGLSEEKSPEMRAEPAAETTVRRCHVDKINWLRVHFSFLSRSPPQVEQPSFGGLLPQ